MTSRQASEAAGERRRGQRATAVGEESVHRITDCEFGHTRSDFDHHAGAFTAEHGVVGEHAQRDHDVAEVRRHGVQRHPYPAGLQWCVGVGDRLQLQILERARIRYSQPPRHVVRWGPTEHQLRGYRAPAGRKPFRLLARLAARRLRVPRLPLDRPRTYRSQRARSDRDARSVPTAPIPTPRRPPNR